MSDDAGHELVLGNLDLIGRMPQGEYTISVLGDDATWGNPQSVTTSLQGLLQDGARISLESWENREAFLRVTITAGTGAGLAEGEDALLAELGRRNTLTWASPGGFSVPTVFDVEWSELNQDFDDFTETELEREYAIRLTCQPFARSVNPTLSEVMSAPPPPPPAMSTVLDMCDTTAGWSAVPSPVLSADGHVYNGTWGTSTTGQYGVWLTRTGSIDSVRWPYMVVEWRRERRNWTAIWSPPRLLLNDNTSVPALETKIIDGGTWARSVYPLIPSRIDWITFKATESETHRINIRQIELTDQIPATLISGHQLARTIEIGGSARTQASLHLWRDDMSLGDVLIHTSSTPNGMFSCEPFLSTASAPADFTVTGSEKDASTGVVYDISASLFNPAAPGREVIARLRRPGTGPITVTVQPMRDTLSGGAEAVGEPEAQTFTPPAIAALRFVSLGVFNMPPRRVDGEAAVMRVTVQGAGAVLDDLWFADIETGSLTWADGITAGLRHLWADSPTVDSPLPRVRAALDLEGHGGYEVDPISMGRHDFPPGPLHVYTVATNARSSSIQLEYFKRWHTHARE